MPRTLKIAAVQMDAAPAPLAERLNRASDLIAEAVGSGAKLVALPELFNTGYEYSDHNYALAENMQGETVQWMRNIAVMNKIYLAGTLLLRDGNEVYNSALLVSPDGHIWRYDKRYPWGWERAYFRDGSGITVAETDFGKIGMMICWDYSHENLWKAYAGKVDMMLVLSCPPKIHEMRVHFPDGTQVNATAQIGFFEGNDEPFGRDLDEKVRWLGVPALNTTGSGAFTSKIPAPELSLLSTMLSDPANLALMSQAKDAQAHMGYYHQTKIISADGEVLSRVEGGGDGFTLAEVEIPDQTPFAPDEPLPPNPYNWVAYLISDGILPAITTPLYRHGYRQQFGQQMAPYSTRTKAIFTILLTLGATWLLRRATR